MSVNSVGSGNMSNLVMKQAHRLINLQNMRQKNKEMYKPIMQVGELCEKQLKELNRLDQQHCKRMHFLNKAKKAALNSDSSLEMETDQFFSPRGIQSQQQTRAATQLKSDATDQLQNVLPNSKHGELQINENPTYGYLQDLTFKRETLYEINSKRQIKNRSTAATPQNYSTFQRAVLPKMHQKSYEDPNLDNIFQQCTSESSEEKFHSPIKSEDLYTGEENRHLVQEMKSKASSHRYKRKNVEQINLERLKEKIEADNKLTNPERLRPKTQSEQNICISPNYLNSNLTKRGSDLSRAFLKLIEKNRNLQGMSVGALSHEEQDLLQNKRKINQCKPETMMSYRTARQQKMSSSFIRGLKKTYFKRTEEHNAENFLGCDGHIKEQKQQSNTKSNDDTATKPKHLTPRAATFSRNKIAVGPLSNKAKFWQSTSNNFIKKRVSMPRSKTQQLRNSPVKNTQGDELDGTETESHLSISKEEKRYFRLKRAKELLKDRTPMMLDKYPMRLIMSKPMAAHDDEDAPEYMKISHMPRYKLKQKNEKWMKQMDTFRADCKDKLHYYQLQINELPEGKAFAEDMLSSKDFKEGIFGKDMKHADKRSLRMYNDHVSTFKLMAKQLCTDRPIQKRFKAMLHSKLNDVPKSDMLKLGMKHYEPEKKQPEVSPSKRNIEDDAIQKALAGLRNEGEEILKDKYEASIGKDNNTEDMKLLDKMNKGDLKNAALTMSVTEDTAVFKRMLELKSRKLVQYLAVFFAGNLKTSECITLKQKIGRGLENLFKQYGYDSSLSKIHVDMKSTVLNHCQSEDNSGQLLHLIADEIAQKVQFFDTLKQTNDCGNLPFTGVQLSADDLDMIDAKRKFIQELNKHLVTMLPLLLKVKEQRLVLRSYQINAQLCMGLNCAFTTYPMMIKQLRLESNNVSDESFAVLLKGLYQQDYISSITYAKNEFGDKSVKALGPLLEKRNQLRELNIFECKVRKNVCTELFKIMKNCDNLETFAITNAKMSPDAIPYLCEYLRNSCKLHSLDISWNGLRAQQMLELCEAVADNRYLKHLNISNNTLVNPTELTWKKSNEREAAKYYQEGLKAKEDNKVAIRNIRRQGGQVPYELLYPPKPIPIQDKSVTFLCDFIKQNKKLLHLDLSYMGLDEQTLLMFGKAVRRCKSMVSLHLSGNPGNCESARTAFAQRIHCKKFDEKFVMNYPENQEKDKHQWLMHIEESMSNSEGEHRLSEAESLKKVLVQRKTHKVIEQKGERDISDILIFERKLGLKTEMPGSGQWNMVTTSRDMDQRCWCCALHRYTLVFWTSEIGFFDLKNYPHDVAFEDVINEIEQREAENKVDGYREQVAPVPNVGCKDLLENPKIFGSFNNWRGQKMYRVEDLCFLLDKQRDDLVEILRKKCKVGRLAKEVSDLNDKYTRRTYGTRKAWRSCLANSTFFKEPELIDLDRICGKKAKFMRKELHLKPKAKNYGSGSDSEVSSDKQRYDVSETEPSDEEELKILAKKRLAAKKLAKEGQQISTKTQKALSNYSRSQIYVAPLLLPPGKHFYVVKGQVLEGDADQQSEKSLGSQLTGNVQTKYFQHTMQVRPRQEPIPLFKKQIKRMVNVQETFNVADSVFKDWKYPSSAQFAKMIAYDMKCWKLNKFEKDRNVQKEVQTLFINNIEKLYSIYIEVAAGSNFPIIKWLAWAEFAELLYEEGEIEGNAIDRIFNTVTAGTVCDGFFRYMFFEAIVRLARAKYLIPGKVETTAEAVRKLFSDDLFSEKGPSTTNWNSFLRTHLYHKDVNGAFFANLKGLQRLFIKHGDNPTATHSKQDCIDLMCKTKEILGYEKEAVLAFGLSKMPVLKDREKKGRLENIKMNFVEFLVFIGRSASMAYRTQTHLTYFDRLKLSLDALMDIIGLDRLEPEIVIDEESYSDDEY